MAYKLLVTQQAGQDLDGIFDYLVSELRNREAALRLADEAERQYALLVENLRLHEECRQALLRKAHYRKASMGGYVMIYRVEEAEKMVYILRFFSNLQNYASKL